MLRELWYTFCRLCHCLNKHHSHIFFGLKIHHHMLPLRICHLAIPISLSPWGARVAQWWEYSPPPQCGPGSNPGVDGICGLSLLLVLYLAPRGFSPGTPVFPSPQKPAFPNSNSARNQVNEEPLCGCATCKSLFIYLFNLEVCMMFDTWTYSRTSI